MAAMMMMMDDDDGLQEIPVNNSLIPKQQKIVQRHTRSHSLTREKKESLTNMYWNEVASFVFLRSWQHSLSRRYRFLHTLSAD